MNDNNSTKTIRSGLTNYIGALLNASVLNPNEAKHDIVAMLTEESLKLAKIDNDYYDLFTLKPLLRAVVIIYQNKVNLLNQDLQKDIPPMIKEQLLEKQKIYNQMIQMTNKLIDEIKL